MFSYVITLGTIEDGPRLDFDHEDDQPLGRFATFVLTDRLVVPFTENTELVLASGSEVTGLVVGKEWQDDGGTGEDENETASRVVNETTGRRSAAVSGAND